jgi:hyaluronan synthase
MLGAIAGTGWMLEYYGSRGELSGYVWLAVLVAQAAYLALQAVLWLRYEPFQPEQGVPLPALSVIIPAYNAGFRAARGEIVLTLDSDSEIEPQTLRAMVAPFQADSKVGAVAGRVSVLNRNNMIGRMLEVQYALAFDFGRAAQSAYRTVACCPGALSAFRREVIVPYLEEWLDQRFLGRPVSHGEDQALTNIVLKQGHDTVYQRTAVVHTLAPQRYGQLTKMLTRWDRSYIVEGFAFAKFMFTGYRKTNRVLPVVTFVVSNVRLLLLYYGLLQLPAVLFTRPGMLANFVAAFVITAFLSSLYYLQTERSLRFL